jgi:hypothetical protein
VNQFHLESSMLATFGGAFYPTGYTMVMFPDPKDAIRVGQQLVEAGFDAQDVLHVPAAILISQITPTVRDADDPLPSAGTEGATVRALTELAHKGHAGLLVKTGDEDVADRMMKVVREVPYSMAQRYRALVIEDL